RPTGFILALVLGLACSTSNAVGQEQVRLPSVDEVLNNFSEALGGEMAIAGMSEVQFKGSFSGQTSGELEVKYKDGKYVFTYTLEGVGRVQQGFDGKNWWRSLPGKEKEAMVGEEAAMARQFAICTPQFLNWREFDGTIEVVERTEMRGKDVWRLTFIDKDDVTKDRYFDREAGLLVVASLRESHPVSSTTLYKFEDFEGVLWPTRITSESRINGAAESITTVIEFTEFDFDVQLDDDEFTMASALDSDN
ncbi:MAG: hypothetical protein ACR2NP_12305, partial [Pirellulaceae bacterium]